MTPAARIASAIGILDDILNGAPAEKTLTNWARSNRFAGSGDRAAIRDHVFDALRCRRSFGYLGGGHDGRSLMIGTIRAAGGAPDQIFTGQGYGPAKLTDDEQVGHSPTDMPEAVRLDCPDWLVSTLKKDLGDDFTKVMESLQHRSPLFLRVNLHKTTRQDAIDVLARDGIPSVKHGLSETAILVTGFPRRVQNSVAYQDGLVEIQDAASQALVDFLPLKDDDRVLDFCAGGGGKSLAMAGRASLKIVAHDDNVQRMRDIPVRSGRADVLIEVVENIKDLGEQVFDLVLCDVPCSGSGAWRRSPQAKWTLSEDRLSVLSTLQQEILTEAAEFVSPGGTLAYATCSLLIRENAEQVADFTRKFPEWSMLSDKSFTPLDGGDGFYVALLTRV